MTRARTWARFWSTLLALTLPAATQAQSLDTLWVTVDGHRMHLLVAGSGGPTVVLEAGGSSTHRVWSGLQATLATKGRVVSYDRPGFGRSEVCTRPRNASVVADELREALRAARLEPPYIMVGHSLGGAFARVFSARYPGDVLGLVLVDPAQEDFYPRAEREQPALFQATDTGEVRRMAAGPPGDRAELAAWDASMTAARASDSALSTPTILLSSPRTDLGVFAALWTDEQRKWAARMPQVEYRRVDGAGHAIHRDRPDAVLSAIDDLRPRATDGVVHDLVIQNGRIMDPASGLDAVRSVGITRGTIRAVSAQSLRGRDTLDARGLVVAPGFIDLHQHAQDDAAYRVEVLDGTTTALELEEGTADVDKWYDERANKALINYGVSVGHAKVRMRVMGDSGVDVPTGPAASRAATDGELAAIIAQVDRGLRRGAVAAGILIEYTPAARPWEIFEMFRVAAAHRASVHVHVRNLDAPYYFLETEEVIAAAAASGAAAHVVHIQSSGGEDTPRMLELIRGARARGIDVTAEAYPYTASMSPIDAAGNDGWESWPDSKFGRFEWPASGERLTRESFGRYRKQGGDVIDHNNTEDVVTAAVADSLTMIASDGLLSEGAGHPRVAGTFARVLGHYVREVRALTLMDALRKMTIAPARRLEQRVPAMAFKGRLQVGADADIVIFDPVRIIDRATYREPTLPPLGIRDVLVNGVVVVRSGALQRGVLQQVALPGRAVRAPIR